MELQAIKKLHDTQGQRDRRGGKVGRPRPDVQDARRHLRLERGALPAAEDHPAQRTEAVQEGLRSQAGQLREEEAPPEGAAPPSQGRPRMSRARLTWTLASAVGVTAIALIGAASAGAAFLTPEYAMTVTGEGDHLIGNPQTIAVDEATHDFYVADKENQRIEKFDAEGNFLFNITGFSNPISIAVDNSNGP